MKACRECKQQISEAANPCPHCGKKDPHGKLPWVLLGCAGAVTSVCIVSAIGAALVRDKAESIQSAASSAPDAVAEQAELQKRLGQASEVERKRNAQLVEAVDLWKDYQANEVSADNIYKGKGLLVLGTVDSITKDVFQNVVVRLKSPNQFMGVMATLREDQAGKAASLANGQRVRLVCEGNGAVATIPMLGDCTLD